MLKSSICRHFCVLIMKYWHKWMKPLVKVPFSVYGSYVFTRWFITFSNLWWISLPLQEITKYLMYLHYAGLLQIRFDGGKWTRTICYQLKNQACFVNQYWISLYCMALFIPYNKMQVFKHLAYKYSSDSMCVWKLSRLLLCQKLCTPEPIKCSRLGVIESGIHSKKSKFGI